MLFKEYLCIFNGYLFVLLKIFEYLIKVIRVVKLFISVKRNEKSKIFNYGFVYCKCVILLLKY